MPTKIIFEEKEKSEFVIKEDCTLSLFSQQSDAPTKHLQNYRTNRAVGTNTLLTEAGSGSSFLTVNSGTSYEFQRLNAASLHRAIADSKLGEFLDRVLPIIEEQLQFSAQKRRVAEKTWQNS